MENNQIKVGTIYVIGIVVNLIPAIFTWFFKSDVLGGSENFLGGFYLFFFLHSFIFYALYFFLKVEKNRYNKVRRGLISFSPCLLYIALVLFFCYLFDDRKAFAFLAFSPCIILNLLYALITESRLKNRIESTINAEKTNKEATEKV